MKTECLELQRRFLENYSIPSSVEEMWLDIRTTLSNILESSVPSKMTSTRFNQPWITKEVKALSRRKKRSFKKANMSKKDRDKNRYHQLKSATRSACKKAYNDYITNIISPDSTSNPKTFLGFYQQQE